jgi:pantetheine-phosphate adenylyltransferase
MVLTLFSMPHTKVRVEPFASPTTPSEAMISPTVEDSFPVVALGGTFDHLHAGHKILLSMSAWIASRKVIVGTTGTTPCIQHWRTFNILLTDDALLEKKSNRDVLESIDTRMKCVTAFLNLFKPGLEYDVVPIQDVYGPTAWDPDIQALVVSKETMSGADSSRYCRKGCSRAE